MVSLLTSRAISVDLLDVGEAEQALEDALELPSSTPELTQIKDTAVRRARGQIRSPK